MQHGNLSFFLTALTMILVSCSTTTSIKTDATRSIYCSEGPSLSIPRAGHAGGIVDNKLLIVGGNNWSDDRKTKNWLCDTSVFDGNSWQSGYVFPSAIADMMYAYDTTGLYICGGMDGSSKLRSTYLFKSAKESPFELSPLPIATDNGGAALLNGILYVVCGATADGLTNKMWRLDTTTQQGTWKECRALPGSPREFPAVVACGNYVYVLGGVILQQEQPTKTVLRDTYRYDPVIDKWEKRPDLMYGGYAWSASAIDNQSILLTGRASENAVNDSIWLVYLDDMSMRIVGNLRIQACAAPLVRVTPKTWWYIGGEPDTNRSRTAIVTVISLER